MEDIDFKLSPTLTARKPTETSESLLPFEISRNDIVLEKEVSVKQNNTNYLYYFLIIWFLLWISITTLQIVIYVKIWSVINDIKDVSDDWNHLKQLLCQLISVPDLC